MNDDWRTPPEVFEWLDRRFNFTLDPCGSPAGPLREGLETWTEDGLTTPWTGYRVYMNPPYSSMPAWVAKAASSPIDGLVVGLLRGDPSTKWWQMWVEDERTTVLWWPKRIRFRRLDGAQAQTPNFPSAIVVWWGGP